MNGHFVHGHKRKKKSFRLNVRSRESFSTILKPRSRHGVARSSTSSLVYRSNDWRDLLFFLRMEELQRE